MTLPFIIMSAHIRVYFRINLTEGCENALARRMRVHPWLKTVLNNFTLKDKIYFPVGDESLLKQHRCRFLVFPV